MSSRAAAEASSFCRAMCAAASAARRPAPVAAVCRAWSPSRDCGVSCAEAEVDGAPSAAPAVLALRLRRVTAKPTINATTAAPRPAATAGSTGGNWNCPPPARDPVAGADIAGALLEGAFAAPCDAPPTGACAAAPDAAAPVLGAADFPAPMPCFCNSISTRFFSASNCWRLESGTRGCEAGCAAAEVAGWAGVAPDAEGVLAGAAPAGSLAGGWIAPLQTCVPLAVAAGTAWLGVAAADVAGVVEAEGEAEVVPGAEAPAAAVLALAAAALPPVAAAADAVAAAALADAAVPAMVACGNALGACPCAWDADDEAAAAVTVAAEAAGAADAATPLAAGAPVASSAGTLSTAPSFSRFESWPMNAPGFASNRARVARASVARSCDCVTSIATSLSDCPGRTVY